VLHPWGDLSRLDDDPRLRAAQDREQRVTVGCVDVGVRLRVLLGRVELGDFRRDRCEQPEGERRQAQDAEDEQEGEKSELADAPPLPRARLCPKQRQCGGSLALLWASKL